MIKINIFNYKNSFNRTNIVCFVIIIILIAAVIFYFYPRNLGKVVNVYGLKSSDIKEIKITSDEYNLEHQQYIITDKNVIDEMLYTFLKNNIRHIIFHKSYVTANYEGYCVSFIMEESNKQKIAEMFIFTNKIISIDNKQYVIYGDSFINEFESILK